MTTNTTKFGRVVELTITNMVDQKKIVVEGLRVTFNVTKTDKAGDNKAKITIYNLGKESRELIQTQVAKNGNPQTHVELRCGYAGEPARILFRGVGEVESSHKPPQWETEITCEDGVQELKAAPYEKNFPAGTTLRSVIKDMMKSLGIPLKGEVPVNKTIPVARTFSGNVLSNIKDLEGEFGFKFDIEDQGGLVRPEDERLQNATITTLGRESGLINSPRRKGALVICDALLDANLKPSNYVKLTTKEIVLNGEYAIVKATFRGDSWSGDWKVNLELEDAPPSINQIQFQQGVLV